MTGIRLPMPWPLSSDIWSFFRGRRDAGTAA